MGILQRKGSSEGAALASCRLLKIRRGITVARFFEGSPPERSEGSLHFTAGHLMLVIPSNRVQPVRNLLLVANTRKADSSPRGMTREKELAMTEEEKARVGRASRPFRRDEAPPPRLSLHTPCHPESLCLY